MIPHIYCIHNVLSHQNQGNSTQQTDNYNFNNKKDTQVVHSLYRNDTQKQTSSTYIHMYVHDSSSSWPYKVIDEMSEPYPLTFRQRLHNNCPLTHRQRHTKKHLLFHTELSQYPSSHNITTHTSDQYSTHFIIFNYRYNKYIALSQAHSQLLNVACSMFQCCTQHPQAHSQLARCVQRN